MTDNMVIGSMIEMFSEDAKWNLATTGSGAALKRHPGQEEELKSKIKMCLSGDDLTPYGMRQIRRHFELEDVLRDETVPHLHAAIYLHNLLCIMGLIDMRIRQCGSRKLLKSGWRHWGISQT